MMMKRRTTMLLVGLIVGAGILSLVYCSPWGFLVVGLIKIIVWIFGVHGMMIALALPQQTRNCGTAMGGFVLFFGSIVIYVIGANDRDGWWQQGLAGLFVTPIALWSLYGLVKRRGIHGDPVIGESHGSYETTQYYKREYWIGEDPRARKFWTVQTYAAFSILFCLLAVKWQDAEALYNWLTALTK